MWPVGIFTWSAAAFGRIVIVNLLPSSVVVFSAWLSIRVAGLQRVAGRQILHRLFTFGGSIDTSALLVAVFLVIVLAVLFQTFQVRVVRLFEGYWGKRIIPLALARAMSRRHGKRIDRLKGKNEDFRRAASTLPLDSEELKKLSCPEQRRANRRHTQARAYATFVDEQLEFYPPDQNELLPTRLGNAMLGFERRAGERYGYETIPIWPRLYPYISDRLVAGYHSSVDALDAAVNLTVAFTIAAVVLLAASWRAPLVLWLPAGCFLVALLAYRAAVSSARLIGLMEYVGFDLHRFDMLEGLHLPLPPDSETEIVGAGRLSEFFGITDPMAAQQTFLHTVYDHSVQRATAETSSTTNDFNPAEGASDVKM